MKLIAISLGLSLLVLACSAEGQTNAVFAIHLTTASAWAPGRGLDTFNLSSNAVITEADLISYSWTNHVITIRSNAIERLPVFRTETYSNFVVIALGQRCYAGSFWPRESARPMPTDTPIIQVWSDPRERYGTTALAIEIPVRSFDLNMQPSTFDPRPDERVFDSLDKIGKITGKMKQHPDPAMEDTARKHTGAQR